MFLLGISKIPSLHEDLNFYQKQGLSLLLSLVYLKILTSNKRVIIMVANCLPKEVHPDPVSDHIQAISDWSETV